MTTVIVRFVSVRAKEQLMTYIGNLRSLPELGSTSKLFLTTISRGSISSCSGRSHGRDKGFKFVWAKSGKCLAKETEGCPVLKINSVNDLDVII